MHPRIPSTPISRKLSSSLVKALTRKAHSQVRSAPPILKIPPNPANPASDNHRLRVELLAAVDTWSRPFKMGHMQDVLRAALARFSPDTRVLPPQSAVSKVFSVPLRVLRGQKGVKVFFVPLRGPSWIKRVKGVLRAPPRPSASSADKKVLRCSSCPFVALRG